MAIKMLVGPIPDARNFQQHSTIHRDRFHGRGRVVVENAPSPSPPAIFLINVFLHFLPFLRILRRSCISALTFARNLGLKAREKVSCYLEFGNNKVGENRLLTRWNESREEFHARSILTIIIIVEISNRCSNIISVSIVVLVLVARVMLINLVRILRTENSFSCNSKDIFE